MPTVYNAAKVKLLNGTLDLDTDVIRVALIANTTAYTADPDNEEFVSDVIDGGTTAAECSGTGYSRQTLASAAVTVDNVDDEAVFDATDVSYTGIDAGTIQGILLYKRVGADDSTPADDDLILYIDDTDIANLPLVTNGSDVTIQWNTEGILNLG